MSHWNILKSIRWFWSPSSLSEWMCVVNWAPWQGAAAMGVRMNTISMCERVETTNRRMHTVKSLKNVLLRRVLFPNFGQATCHNQIVGHSIYLKPRLPGRAVWDCWCESWPSCGQWAAQEGSWQCSCGCNFGGKTHIFWTMLSIFSFGEHAVLPKLLIEHQFVQLFFNNSRYGMSCEANRSKDVFSKYVDSVLQKCAKIRSLVGDLHKNYTTDPTAKKLLIPIHVYTCGGHKVNMSRLWISLRVVAK